MTTEEARRKAAVSRLKAKRAFTQNVASYVIINSFLVALWFVTSNNDGQRGYFWPIWVILGWGIGLASHAWAVYGRGGITEDQIQREMQRGGDVVE